MDVHAGLLNFISSFNGTDFIIIANFLAPKSIYEELTNHHNLLWRERGLK